MTLGMLTRVNAHDLS